MTRYARQIILPEVGTEGQKRLANSNVLVVGAGGLGVPVLQYLAGAGVGRITLVDPDVVETGNLHRQPLYSEKHVGMPKAGAASDILSDLNPDCSVTPLVGYADPANLTDLCTATDAVLDCADSYAASYAISDVCFETKVPLISGSALGFSGYAGGFCGGAPSLRAVFPELPDRAATCATSGVLGPVVGTIGAIQAQMALSVLLGAEPSPLGQLISFDAQSWRMGGFRFNSAPEPEGRQYGFLSPDEMDGSDFIVDLRSEAEAPRPAAPHALRIPSETFGTACPRPDKRMRVVLVCHSGLRAWKAAEILKQNWEGEIKLVAFGNRQKENT